MSQGDSSSAGEDFKQEGNEKYKKGDYRGAVVLYTQAIDAAPTTVEYYGNRAAANFMLQKYVEVINDCNRALVIEPTFMKGYVRKAKAQLAMGNIQDAIATYQTGLIRDPNNASMLSEKRQAEILLEKVDRTLEYLKQEKFHQAASLAKGILETCPGAVRVKLAYAEGLVGCERYDEAFAILTELMRANAGGTETLYLRSKCLYFQGDFASAIKHLQQALRSDPDNSKYMVEIKRVRSLESKKEEANEFFKKGEWQNAIDGYTECLSIDPKNKSFNAKLHCNRATALSKLRKFEEAVSDCDKAIYCDSSYAKAYLRKAECLKTLGGKDNLEQALRELDSAGKLVGDEGQRDIQMKMRETKVALKKAKRKDFYKILEVTQDANESEIKKAYRRLALLWHPDRHSSKSEEEQKKAELIFKDIGEAYAILSDAEKKQRYDSGVDLEDLESGGCGGGGHGGVDPSDIFQMFFGGGMPGGMGGMPAGFGGMGGGSGRGGMPGGVRFHYG